MSRLCIFLFISTPKDGGETDGKIPLPDLRGQEEDRGVAPDRRPAGRHRGPPLRPLHHDLQVAPARRDRRAGRKPARGVQRRAGREAAPRELQAQGKEIGRNPRTVAKNTRHRRAEERRWPHETDEHDPDAEDGQAARLRCFLIAAGGRVFRFQGAKPSTPAEAGPR